MKSSETTEPTSETTHPQQKRRKSFIISMMRSLPMLLCSVTLHLFILFLLGLMGGEPEVMTQPEVTHISDFVPVEQVETPPEPIEMPPVVDPIIDPTDIAINPTPMQDTKTETPDVTDPEKELEIADDLPMFDPSEFDLDTNPEPMGLSTLFVPSGPSSGGDMPNGYGKRRGKAKKSAIAQSGGDVKTEEAVDRALQWLSHHQSDDGSWDASRYDGNLNGKDHVAITAAALLPFLGAGHSERVGSYKKTVKAGIDYINAQMRESNTFKIPKFVNNYGSSLALMALSEATLFGSSPSTKKNANRIAEYLVEQYLNKPGQGWHYGSGGDDFSVSGWVALGLKSAKAADLPTMRSKGSKQVFHEYKHWVTHKMCDVETGLSPYREGQAGRPHMMWVGMFQKQFLGYPSKDAFLKKASENTLDYIKKQQWVGSATPGDVYGIYYGTLSSFQQQGSVWSAWNLAMKPTIVGSQLPGDPKHLGGSWDPTKGHTSEKGGRVLTTALMALCLEVYYRYDMMN